MQSNQRSNSAPAGQAALHNLILTSSISRNINSASDSQFLANRSSLSNNQNSAFLSQEAQSQQTVHTIVPEIVQRCIVAQNTQTVTMIRPPEEECYLLAQWASVDSYNKAVICSMGGVEAVIQAMQTFPTSIGLQECGCLVLGNLSQHQHLVWRAGGVQQIIRAAQHHPTSVAVQSAVCEALQRILSFDNNNSSNSRKNSACNRPDREMEVELLDVLQHASTMYLSNRNHKTAEQLLAKTLLLAHSPEMILRDE